MKRLPFLFLIILSGTAHPQKLKDRIQGDWLCTGIIDSKGHPAPGRFGASDEYLKFSFHKSKLLISEAPFDEEISIVRIEFKNENSFDCIFNPLFRLPERTYQVKELTDKYLTLTTKRLNGEIITFHFSNQKNFPYPANKKVIDNGILIVNHTRLSRGDPKYIDRTFEYQILNDSIFLSQRPIFKSPGGGSFGPIFSYKMNLPRDFKLNERSNEMILDFDVAEGGASNYRISKGFSYELNAEVLRVMEKLRKRWKPVVVDGKPVKTTLRFHLYFYMAPPKSRR